MLHPLIDLTSYRLRQRRKRFPCRQASSMNASPTGTISNHCTRATSYGFPAPTRQNFNIFAKLPSTIVSPSMLLIVRKKQRTIIWLLTGSRLSDRASSRRSAWHGTSRYLRKSNPGFRGQKRGFYNFDSLCSRIYSFRSRK